MQAGGSAPACPPGKLCAVSLVPVQRAGLDADHPALHFHRLWIGLPRHDGVACWSLGVADGGCLVSPWAMTCRVVAHARGSDFQALHTGPRFAHLSGGDVTGKWLAEMVTPETVEDRRRLMSHAVKTNRVRYAAAFVDIDDLGAVWVTVGLFPVWDVPAGQPGLVAVAAPNDATLRGLV